MQRDAAKCVEQDASAQDAGRAAPTPLFLGFLGALVLVGAMTFRRGLTLSSAADFLLLAAVVSGAVLVAFAVSMIWATRAAQRAGELARARPGALVVRVMRVRGVMTAMQSLDSESPLVPLGFTLVADDSGLELWGGAAEQPARLVRVPWEAVRDIRRSGLTRWGRTSAGITVVSTTSDERGGVELPLAVVGAGLGGLFAPGAEELGELIDGLDARRRRALARA